MMKTNLRVFAPQYWGELEKFMKVKNINGTSGYNCKCGSWLEHWKNFGGKSIPTYCSEKSCTNKPEVGAHVQKDVSYDNSWYIIPLCSKHNFKAESMDIGDSVRLVPANVSETCGE